MPLLQRLDLVSYKVMDSLEKKTLQNLLA